MLAAVHHAEVVAHRVGEPFGSLVLAVAVTIIEVALIVTLMASGGKDTASLARDTVFAAVMITCNGIVGLSLFVGALRFRLISFNAEGTGAALATVTTLAVMTMVVPTFTTSAPARFSTAQLAFAAVTSLALYGMFVSTQTRRHRDFFYRSPTRGPARGRPRRPAHRPRDRRQPGAVAGLARRRRRAGEGRVTDDRGRRRRRGLPSRSSASSSPCSCSPRPLPSTPPAQADPDQPQLALGSAMASIGLTIPAIAVASIWLEGLLLELGPQMVLALTVVVSVLTVVPGRATRRGACPGPAGCIRLLAINP